VPALFIPNPNLEQEIKSDSGVRRAMDEVGDAGLEELKERIPVDSGALLASATIIRLEDAGQRLQVSVDYWGFPEYGTENMPAQPYLRPTLSALGLNLT